MNDLEVKEMMERDLKNLLNHIINSHEEPVSEAQNKCHPKSKPNEGVGEKKC
jgi:hypothetical protein